MQKDNSFLFTSQELELLESIWLTYGDVSANELEGLTHKELPWIEARKGCKEWENCSNIISPNTMKEYYKSIYAGE